MAQSKMKNQVLCPNCNAGNLQGSPYCSSCGGPLDAASVSSVHAPATPRAAAPRTLDDPVARLSGDGQDRGVVKQMYDRAAVILTEGESIEYVAVARGSLGHTPDCAVATNKRLLLYRKKVLGKVELDDCYWRDLDSITRTDVKGGVNLMLHAIQGWHLPVENMPQSQAARLYDVATTFSERLRTSGMNQGMVQHQTTPALQVPQSGALSPVFSQTHTEPGISAPATPSTPNLGAPSTPLILPLLTSRSPAGPTTTGMRLGEQRPATDTSGNPSTAPTSNSAYYIPTPESVLQNILQSSTFDGDVEPGVPTRPMQWSAAAFQAPAVADGQPIMLSEHDEAPVAVSGNGIDNGVIKPIGTSDVSPPLPDMGALNHNGNGSRGSGSLIAEGKGHDTEPQLRIAPPLTTLERIAVFSLPSGSLGHDASGRLSSPLDIEPLPVVDAEFHLVPSFPADDMQDVGGFPTQVGRPENNHGIDLASSEEDPLRVLAKKISGPLDDILPFSSSQLQALDWSLDNTGVIAEDNLDAQNNEHISAMPGPDDLSGPLVPLVSENSTVPDPELAEGEAPEDSQETIEAQAVNESPSDVIEVEAASDLAAPAEVEAHQVPDVVEPQVSTAATDEFISILGYADETLSVDHMAAPPLSAPAVPPSAYTTPYEEAGENEPLFSLDSANAHPTAPMGTVDDFLPVPGSMASGPLLAASSSMDQDTESGYKNASPMATQRLEYEHHIDPDDRPTSINLTMSNLSQESSERPISNWRNGVGTSNPASRGAGEEPKKSRSNGSATSSRSSSAKAPAEDPIAKMKQLKALLDAGLITDEDYASKKAEILSRI